LARTALRRVLPRVLLAHRALSRRGRACACGQLSNRAQEAFTASEL